MASRPEHVTMPSMPLRQHLIPILSLVMLAAPVSAGPAALQRVTLANGLRVVLAPDSAAVSVDAALWFPSGTRHERATQSGLALLAARLGFRNGEDRPLAPLEAVGGSGSLVATPDYTSFSATVAPNELATALQFLAARMPGVPVTAAALAAERAALRAERDRNERTAVARGLAQLWSAAWPGSPYAATGALPPAPAAALKPADVDGWRRARYSPSASVLTLAGAFDPAQALAAVRERFEKLPRGTAPAAGAAAAPRPTRRVSEVAELPVRLCLVGWRGPGLGDPDAPALELLAAWLGANPSARLGQSLVKDWSLAIAAQAGFTAQRDGSLLWTLAVVPAGVDSVGLERTLLEAASTATQRDLEAFELERARRASVSAAAFGLQTMRQRGQWLGESEMLAGEARGADARIERLSGVSAADVRRAATRVMTDANRAVVWLLPDETGGAR